jgi:hypothetical protein
VYGWKLTVGCSVALVLIGALSAYEGLVIGVINSLVLNGWLCFLGGASYRRSLVENNRCPRWRFLIVEGDCPTHTDRNR